MPIADLTYSMGPCQDPHPHFPTGVLFAFFQVFIWDAIGGKCLETLRRHLPGAWAAGFGATAPTVDAAAGPGDTTPQQYTVALFRPLDGSWAPPAGSLSTATFFSLYKSHSCKLV